MNNIIQWSPRAVSDIDNHMAYLQREWNQKIVIKVLDRIEKVIDSISNNPELYPPVQSNRNIHRCVVTPQLVLYYRAKGDIVELITFWDSRRDPEDIDL